MNDLLSDPDFLEWERDVVGELTTDTYDVMGERFRFFKARHGRTASTVARHRAHGNLLFNFKTTHSDPWEWTDPLTGDIETVYSWDEPMEQSFKNLRPEDMIDDAIF